MRGVMRTISGTLLLTLLLPLTVVAHETGVIRLDSKAVAAGGTLEISGSKLKKNTEFKLELRGTLKTYALATVRTDSAGQFVVHLSVPGDAAAGDYSVVAVAADKDVVARTPVALTPPSAASPAPASGGHEGMVPSATGTPHATDARLELPIKTSSAEWLAIGSITALSLIGGLWLLLRDSRAT